MKSNAILLAILTDPVFVMAVSFSFAMLFLSAACHKFTDLPKFRSVLGGYDLIPEKLLSMAHLLIPALETAVAMALLTAGTRQVAALGAISLLLLYAFAMLLSIRNGRTLQDCGCSLGAVKQPVVVGLVVRNMGYAMLAVLLLVSPSARALEGMDLISVAGLVLMLSLFYAIANVLIANQHTSRELFHD